MTRGDFSHFPQLALVKLEIPSTIVHFQFEQCNNLQRYYWLYLWGFISKAKLSICTQMNTKSDFTSDKNNWSVCQLLSVITQNDDVLSGHSTNCQHYIFTHSKWTNEKNIRNCTIIFQCRNMRQFIWWKYNWNVRHFGQWRSNDEFPWKLKNENSSNTSLDLFIEFT